MTYDIQEVRLDHLVAPSGLKLYETIKLLCVLICSTVEL